MFKILYYKYLMINFKIFIGYYNVLKYKFIIDGLLFFFKI